MTALRAVLIGLVLALGVSVPVQAQTAGPRATDGSLRVAIQRGFTTVSTTLLFYPDNTVDIGGSGATPRNYLGSGNVTVGTSSVFQWNGRSIVSAPADGVIMLQNQAATDFTRLQLGGATSSFPALKRNSAQIDVRLADDSGYATLSGTFNVATNLQFGGKLLANNSAPTISSGFGTSPSVASNNGTAAFTINVGTGGAATSGVVGLPTATTGWNCFVNDLTAAAAHVAYNTRQTASTTTTATLENQTTSTGAAVAWAASDILRVSCFGY